MVNRRWQTKKENPHQRQWHNVLVLANYEILTLVFLLGSRASAVLVACVQEPSAAAQSFEGPAWNAGPLERMRQ